MLELIRFDEITTILSLRRWIYPLSIKHNSIDSFPLQNETTSEVYVGDLGLHNSRLHTG